jgi:hypothetical protein
VRERLKNLRDDPRQVYLKGSDADDPVHENMPMVRADPTGGAALVPVVEQTRGHPRPHEIRTFCRQGACLSCLACVGSIVLLFAIGIGMAADGDEGDDPVSWLFPSADCGEDRGDANHSVPEVCKTRSQLSDPQNLLLPGCNQCPTAFDGTCGERVWGKAKNSGECPVGTDGYVY